MKKQNLKSLALNKSKVSNLVDSQVKGGTPVPSSVRFCSFACTLACTGTTTVTDPITQNPGGSECACK